MKGNQYQIYTDGSCDGNPGKGGYACIVRDGQHQRILSGSVPQSTNNKMELLAAIKGLETVKPHSDVTLYTDSQYLEKAVNAGHLAQWQTNGWRRIKTGEPVKNRELWLVLSGIISRKNLNVNFVKVPAHSTHKLNNYADLLARRAAKSA